MANANQLETRELNRQRFGGTVAENALQQFTMVPAEPSGIPIAWYMGTVWGTVTAEIVADSHRHAIQ
jgi:hypothetical protein